MQLAGDLAGTAAAPTVPGVATNTTAIAANTAAIAVRAPLLVPTATKTGAYTAAVGDLAMMNVAGGGTALLLPSAPADKAQVGYRAIGATTAVPLVITAGGSDTIGTAGATTASIPLADEVGVLQYQAASTRWLAVSNVKTQASLDARYPVAVAAGRPIASSLTYHTVPGVNFTGAQGAGTQTANRVVYEPFLARTAITVDQVAILVSTAQATGKARVAIYNADVNWQPTTLVVEAAELDVSTTGAKTATLNQALPAGRYVIAFNVNVASLVFTTLNGTSEFAGVRASDFQQAQFWYGTQIYGAMPGTGTAWTAIASGNTSGQVRTVLLRVSTP